MSTAKQKNIQNKMAEYLFIPQEILCLITSYLTHNSKIRFYIDTNLVELVPNCYYSSIYAALTGNLLILKK